MQSVNPLLIITLLAPLTLFWDWLARRGLRLRPTDKMMIGFLLTTICMGTVCMVALQTKRKAPIVRERGTVHPQAVERALYKLSDVRDAWVLQSPTSSMFLRAKAVVGVAPNEDENKVLTEAAVRAHLEKTLSPGELPDEIEIVQGPVVDPAKSTILWQVFAYILITIAEICISVVGLELAYTAAPKSVKSFVTAIWLLTVFVGAMLTSQIAALYEQVSPWIAGGLAVVLGESTALRLKEQYESHLPGSYFAVLTLMMAAASVGFYFVARWFNRAAASWTKTTATD